IQSRRLISLAVIEVIDAVQARPRRARLRAARLHLGRHRRRRERLNEGTSIHNLPPSDKRALKVEIITNQARKRSHPPPPAPGPPALFLHYPPNPMKRAQKSPLTPIANCNSVITDCNDTRRENRVPPRGRGNPQRPRARVVQKGVGPPHPEGARQIH